MDHLYQLSVLFALITATVAGAYALLAWRLFRQSPVRIVMALLAVAMAGSIAYHGVQIMVGDNSPLTGLVEAGMNTVLLILVFAAIWTDAKLQRLTDREAEK